MAGDPMDALGLACEGVVPERVLWTYGWVVESVKVSVFV
jgi:hypothetical protein